MFGQFKNLAKALIGPKYDGNYLHSLMRDNLKETKLHQTLTNLVIPAFDVKMLQPVIFSSFKVSLLYLLLFLYLYINIMEIQALNFLSHNLDHLIKNVINIEFKDIFLYNTEL